MTARPAPDSRVELLGAHLAARPVVDDDLHLPLWAAQSMAQAKIEEFESAGLLVLDPSSDELVERISDVAEQWVDSIAFLSVDDEPTQRCSQLNDFARAVLAALAAPGGERA